MVFTDQTFTLRSLLDPSSELGRASSSSFSTEKGGSRSKSPAGSGSSSRARSPLRRGPSEEEKEEKEFIAEAYRIHHHLSELRRNLQSTRKPYLSLADPPLSLARRKRPVHAPREGDAGGSHGTDDREDELDGWKKYEHAQYMTDKEREEVDIRGKVILRRCRERVTVMEEGERARQSRILPDKSTNPLFNFLPSLAPSSSPSSASEPLIAAHRGVILWTLNALLAKTSQDLTDLQEERAKRRAERGRTLADGAEKEANAIRRDKEVGVFGRVLDIATGSGSGSGSGSRQANGADGRSADLDANTEPDPTLDLSPEQIQQFESENNALLTHLESTLTSVLSAEKSLLEISEMQTQLVAHLAQQTEMIDTLYEQAVGSVGEMRGAKEQLVKAKERSGEARLFLLVFLIGASLGLLFLDWYS